MLSGTYILWRRQSHYRAYQSRQHLQRSKKVYSISILYFDLGKGSDYIYVGQNNFIGLHTQDQLIISTKEKDTIVRKSPAEIFPTYMLVRVNEFNKVAKSPLEEWVDYLKTESSILTRKHQDCKKLARS